MSSKKQTSPPSRTEATSARRQAILDAALDVFLEKGVLEATIQDIRERSGASIGSIYHHYKSKESIAASLVVEGYASINRHVLAAIERNPPAREGIRDTVRAYLYWYEQHPRWGWFIFRATDLGSVSNAWRDIQALEKEFVERYLQWMAPRIAAGEIRRMPNALYTALLIGPSRDFLRKWLPGADPEQFEEARKELSASAVRSLID